MVYYFSATGNSRHVAERIAEATGDRAVAMEQFDGKPTGDSPVGIVVPTYFCGLPQPAVEFLHDLTLGTPEYLWFLTTYGSSCGGAAWFAAKELGRGFDAYFCVRMPDTWTPVYDLSDKNEVAEVNAAADLQTDEIIRRILAREHGDFVRSKLPVWAAKLGHAVYEDKRKTSRFTVESSCYGCRICERVCPVKAIEVHNGRPVWVKEKCALCLKCLHSCPRFAIQYGRHTRGHGQYLHP